MAVHASATNYFDLLILVGRYQYRPTLPFTLGSECSGVVIEVGQKVKNWKAGDAVIVPMGLGGGLAEEIVVSGAQLMPKPQGLSHTEAAGVGVGFMTAYHGLVHRGNLKKGEVLLVTGAAGGMGLAAIQLGKLLGATVVAAASSDDKLKVAKEAGADHLVNTSQASDIRSAVLKATGGKAVDVCYEVVGGKLFEQCLRLMDGGGRLLVVGFASGKIPSVPANLPLVKGCSIVGVRSGAEMMRDPSLTVEMASKLLMWAKDHQSARQLAPKIGLLVGPERAKEAFKVIADRTVTGKAVVQWRPDTATASKL